MDLRKHLEFSAEQCRGIFSLQGGLAPMIHAIDDKGEHHLWGCYALGGSDEEKDAASDIVREMFEKHNVTQFCLMIEAWQHMVGTSRGVPRMEVVTLIAGDRTAEITGWMEIIRPKDGKPYLGPLTVNFPSEMQGRFVGWLVPSGRKN